MIAVPACAVGCRSGRGGVRENNGGHHSRGLFLEKPGGFEHRCSGLVGAGGVYRNDVLARLGFGINGDVALLRRYACGVAGHSGSRVGNDGVRQPALHEAADVRIDGQRKLEVSGHVALVPAGRCEQAGGSAVGNHENDVLRRFDFIRNPGRHLSLVTGAAGSGNQGSEHEQCFSHCGSIFYKNKK